MHGFTFLANKTNNVNLRHHHIICAIPKISRHDHYLPCTYKANEQVPLGKQDIFTSGYFFLITFSN